MMDTPGTNHELLGEKLERLRLHDLKKPTRSSRPFGTASSMRSVVDATPGESVYTLEGADRPYRLLVEAMQQGVAVLNPDGVILYCNPCLAVLFNMSVEKMTARMLDGRFCRMKPTQPF